MRRSAFAVVVSRSMVAVALAAALGVAAGPAQSAQGVAYTRVVVESTYFDRGAPGRSAGDLTVFAAELRDASTGVGVGLDRGYCTTVRTGAGAVPSRAQCRGSLSLPDGQLDVQGSFDETAFAAGTPQMLALTAGSGAYATAHGQARLVPVDASTSRLTITADAVGVAPRTRELRLTTDAPVTTYLDRGLPGRGAGDETLSVARARGDRNGRLESACLTVTEGNGVVPASPPYLAQCQRTLAFSDGSIVIEGLLDETAYDAGASQTLPIVGGTGAYDHADGEVTFAPTPDGGAAVAVDLAPSVCEPLDETHAEQGIQFAQIPDDQNPSARGSGDLLTSTAVLAEAGTDTTTGTTHAFFLTVDDAAGAAPYVAQASQTIKLPGGTIEMGGVFDQTAFEAFEPVVFVINGGTGRYAGAHGVVVARQVVFPATFELTIDLVCDG